MLESDRRPTLDFPEPFLSKLLGAEDRAGDPRSMHRGVRVERSDENFDLRVDPVLLFGRGADDGERASTLAVQTHVLQMDVKVSGHPILLLENFANAYLGE
jgi:hypothetical protein